MKSETDNCSENEGSRGSYTDLALNLHPQLRCVTTYSQGALGKAMELKGPVKKPCQPALPNQPGIAAMCVTLKDGLGLASKEGQHVQRP